MRRLDFKPKANARYRTVPEATVLDSLLLVSWAAEVDAGGREPALAAASKALHAWIGGGLGFGLDPDGRRLFDPCEVINFLKWAGVTGQDRYWEDHFVKTHRAFVSEFLPEKAGGEAGAAHPSTRFRMSLRRSFDLEGFADGAGVRLRTPVPLPGAYLSDLTITPVVPDGFQGDVIVRDQCLEVRTKVSEDRRVTIGADFDFTATSPVADPAPLSERELDVYLRKSEGLIQVTPRIEALASELGGACASSRAAVDAFWDFMIDTLLSGIIRYSDVPADAPGDWVLDHGWYDCQLGAALLASLCRARGIPARLVGGQCLYRIQPISHYWAEVWFEGAGWLPFDVICWDLSAGGRDPAWRNVFAGRLDYRAPTQCFPLAFTGPMSVRFPPAWHMVQVGAAGGIDTIYSDLETGALIYRDHVAVERLTAAPTEGAHAAASP